MLLSPRDAGLAHRSRKRPNTCLHISLTSEGFSGVDVFMTTRVFLKGCRINGSARQPCCDCAFEGVGSGLSWRRRTVRPARLGFTYFVLEPQPGPRCESAEKTESQTLLAHAPSPRTKPHSAVLDCSAQSSVQWSSSEAGIAARCILSLLQFWATAAPSKLFRHVRLSLKHARDTSSSQPTATPASVKPSMQRRRSFRRKPLLHFRNESPTTSSQSVATS